MTEKDEKMELAPDMLDEVNGGLLYRSIEEDTKEEDDETEEEKTGASKAVKRARGFGKIQKRL